MPKQEHITELELPDAISFHHRQWTFERAGWIALALLLLLAAGGLFGLGPLSRARASSDDAQLTIDYERFARRQAPSALTLTFAPAAVREKKLRFWIARAYLDELGLQQIVPAPASARLSGDRVFYEVDVAPDAGEVRVTFDVEPEHASRLEGLAGLEDGSTVRYWQLIYP